MGYYVLIGFLEGMAALVFDEVKVLRSVCWITPSFIQVIGEQYTIISLEAPLLLLLKRSSALANDCYENRWLFSASKKLTQLRILWNRERMNLKNGAMLARQ
jgi:hypothetical protein